MLTEEQKTAWAKGSIKNRIPTGKGVIEENTDGRRWSLRRIATTTLQVEKELPAETKEKS
jgi:hypothetical protein